MFHLPLLLVGVAFVTDVVMVESWGFGDLMSTICRLKLWGRGVRGSSVGLSFPESHCLAEGVVFAHSQVFGAK